ncbi:MAG: queuosine precursor transporter [Candidatus Peribacteraceae bacterium]|nr:queuosine precursor transporter [Candidatus Peribacteraceae bacterium]
MKNRCATDGKPSEAKAGPSVSLQYFMRPYRHFDLVMAAFVAVLLISNIASSAKILDWGVAIAGLPLSFDAGTLLFPLSYIFGDILTEVYGFARSRRVIWTGFIASLGMSFFFYVIQQLPGETLWQQSAGDGAYAAILGGVSSFGLIIASLSAYFLGEFSNSYILAKMKVVTDGKWLWMRTIGSTIIGQGLDTVVFVAIACAFGVFPWEIALSLIVANYIFKVGIEIILTPLTYAVVSFLKRSEQEDVYDLETNFNPFHF